MRWTKESKVEAEDMIKKNISIEEISMKFNMSKSSVILLKYNLADDGDRIECQICHNKFKQITPKHLLKNHGVSLEEYKEKFGNSDIFTRKRKLAYKNFKSPNKGRTYKEIYGEEESIIKRNKISQKQIGRPCSVLCGTGICGTRKDTNTFARSTYEANIDRIFIFENKKYLDEININRNRFDLKRKDGTKITYCPDRKDIDGLFEKDAFLEIKGYMYPEDWEKIVLFRQQYPNEKLLIISSDLKYYNINYSDLELKYKKNIPLWEDDKNNYKTRPDLYNIDYKTPEHILFLENNYPNHINIVIKDLHVIFIANKCLSFNRVSMGKEVYVEDVRLLKISNRRSRSSKKSTGEYNYELWEILTKSNEKFYVTNQSKTLIFYCYEESKYNDLIKFFENNCDMNLAYGPKKIKSHFHIEEKLWSRSNNHEKYILQKIDNSFCHRNINYIVSDISLETKRETKSGAINQYEMWSIQTNNDIVLYISNFNDSTLNYTIYFKKEDIPI